jgi:nucleoside-diphosphate-sugar epimerase
MKVLVTGGSGFIGRHLIQTLDAQGIEVYALQYLEVQPIPGATFWSLLDIEGVRQFDVVFHLAGVLGKRGIPLQAYMDAHVELPRYLLSRMMQHQLFIYASSAWVTYALDPYERTKIQGEKVVESSNVPHRIIRPGFVIGEGDMHHYPVYWLIRHLRGLTPLIGGGSNVVHPTYVKDVVSLLQQLMYSGNEVTTIVGPTMTMKDFMGCIANHLQAAPPRIKLPHLPGTPKFLWREQPFTSDIPEQDQHTVDDMVKAAIAWYRSIHLL